MTKFGKRGGSDQGGGRIDRYRPVETGLVPERDAPRFFYHDKQVMFWGIIIICALIPIGYYFYQGEPFTGSWTGSAFFVAFAIGAAFYLRATGQLDDKPESDLRGFFLGGPWFLGGAGVVASVFFWFEGISWIWSYDLTDTDSLSNGLSGFQMLGENSQLKGLAGFLEKLTILLGASLAGGAITKQLAVKIGIDDPFE